jgi:hypothetical protein
LGVSGDCYFVKVRDDLYYHGDGVHYGGFAPSAGQIIRFDPYLDDPEDPNMEVPEVIRLDIERLLKMSE